MSANKWTPGPWSFHDHMGGTHETECEDFTAHTVCFGAGNVLLGEVVAYQMRLDAPADAYKGYPRVRSFEENIANGMLITAAPDLAEALELIVNAEILSKTDDLQGMLMYADGIGKARAALAKARGEL